MGEVETVMDEMLNVISALICGFLVALSPEKVRDTFIYALLLLIFWEVRK